MAVDLWRACVLLALAGAAAAQSRPRPAPERGLPDRYRPESSRTERSRNETGRPGDAQRERADEAPVVLLRSYSRIDSHRAFAACDINGDDRLTIIEARRTIKGVQTTEDFQLFDQDEDGIVYFSEFDLRYRNVVKVGSSLALTSEALKRPLRTDPMMPRQQAEMRAAVILREVDTDRNERLSLEEWNGLATYFGSAMEARKTFEELDLDQSHDLTPAELAPLANKSWVVKSASRPVSEDEGPIVRLQPELQPADTDGDNALSRLEITYTLLRLDPRLARLADEVVEAADLNGDGRIGAREATRVEFR